MTHARLPSPLAIATSRAVALRALRIALIVGVVIAVINHGDRIFMGHMDAVGWLKCALTFLVPYGVSTYSSVQATREQARQSAQLALSTNG